MYSNNWGVIKSNPGFIVCAYILYIHTYTMCMHIHVINFTACITPFRFQEIFGSISVLSEEIDALKVELQSGFPLVFCHNDLLCGNLIYNDVSGMPLLLYIYIRNFIMKDFTQRLYT